jgi:hypothetical protein
LVDQDGKLTRVSLLGIIQAANARLTIPAFGGAITADELRAARSDANAAWLFRRGIAARTSDYDAAVLDRIQRAERRDTECLAERRREI